jgi:predicted GNAT superfamily acetyltransferase
MTETNSHDSVDIIPLTEADQLQQVIGLQRAAWGMEDLGVVPSHLLTAVVKSGGMVLGAYAGDKLVGFVLGLVSRAVDGECYLTSHMMGVLPEWQSHNVGFLLKQSQAQRAKADGYRFIRWTYDPMETRNASINIRKLGGRVVSFIPNYYGDAVRSSLQAGLPSDRFLLQWDVSGAKSENTPRGGELLLRESWFLRSGLLIKRHCD